MKKNLLLLFFLSLCVPLGVLAQQPRPLPVASYMNAAGKLEYLDFKEGDAGAVMGDPQIVTIRKEIVVDYQCVPNPGNPSTGNIRVYCDSGTGNLTCLTSTGGSCISSGGGTVTSVTASSPLASSGGSTPNITAPTPFLLNNAGTFTNPNGVTYTFSGTLNSANPSSDWILEQVSGNNASPVVGAVLVPLGATAHQETGVSGFCKTLASSAGLTQNACVGVYAQGISAVTGGAAWGLNPIVDDQGFASNLTIIEPDANVSNSATTGNGIFMTGNWAAQLTVQALGNPSRYPYVGNFPAIRIVQPGAGGRWTSGISFDTGSVGDSAPVIILQPNNTGNSTNSQYIALNATDSGGNHPVSWLTETTTGHFQVNNSPLEAPSLVTGGSQTISGCSLTSALGGAWAGSFHSGTTGTCTVTITPGVTAANGWSCWSSNHTTAADQLHQNDSPLSTTAPTLTGTTVSGDIITWGCVQF